MSKPVQSELSYNDWMHLLGIYRQWVKRAEADAEAPLTKLEKDSSVRILVHLQNEAYKAFEAKYTKG